MVLTAGKYNKVKKIVACSMLFQQHPLPVSLHHPESQGANR
jgi:hypothetical protein